MTSEKTVLITGCSTGIGREAAFTLQTRGYRVIASARKMQDVKALREAGLVHVLQLDLADTVSITRAVHKAVDIADGEIFALFNNGAYGQPGAVEDLSREALRKQFETNVFGTHELTTLVLPHMCKDDARIVQNSSILGFVAMPMRGAYNASKYALEGLSDTLRIELSETNTKVSLIEPGPILTHFRQNALIALEENIDIEASRHQLRYQGALKRLKKPGAASRFTLPSSAVVKKLIHALESPRPRARYPVTFPSHLFTYLKPILPTSVFDRILLAAAKSEG